MRTTIATLLLAGACVPAVAGNVDGWEPPIEAQVVPPVSVVAPVNDTGFYGGLSAIYSDGTSDFGYQVWDNPAWDNTVNPDGFGIGGFVGYEWDLGQTYAAVEVNGSYLGVSGREECRAGIRFCDVGLSAAVDLRLRGGLNFDSTSVGLFAGPSLGLLSAEVLTNPSLTARPEGQGWELGYVVGADVTHDLGGRWFIRGEIGYRSYGGLSDTFREGRYNETIDTGVDAVFFAASVGARF